MAKFAAEFTYTDQEILDLLREGLLRVTVEGQEYEFRGRRFTMANLNDLQEAIRIYENRVNAAANLAAGRGPARGTMRLNRPD